MRRDEYAIEAFGAGASSRAWTRSTLEVAKIIADKAVKELHYTYAHVWHMDKDDIIEGEPLYTARQEAT